MYDKILIKTGSDGKIMTWHYQPNLIADKTGWIEIENYQSPVQQEGKIAEEFYRDGQIVVEYKDIPEPPKTEEQIQYEALKKQVDDMQMAILSMYEGGALNG